MKSKLLVLAVLSTMSLGAQAIDDPEFVSLAGLVPSLTAEGGSIQVVNFSQNIANIDASVTIDAGNDIAFTQQESVALDVSGLGDGVGINVDGNVAGYENSTLITQLSFKAENLGNKIDTNAIGAAVVATNNVNTASNVENDSTSLNGDLTLRGSDYGYVNLDLNYRDSYSLTTLPAVNVINVAYNQAEVDATVGLHAGGDADLQNLQISTSAIGSYVSATAGLAIGVAVP